MDVRARGGCSTGRQGRIRAAFAGHFLGDAIDGDLLVLAADEEERGEQQRERGRALGGRWQWQNVASHEWKSVSGATANANPSARPESDNCMKGDVQDSSFQPNVGQPIREEDTPAFHRWARIEREIQNALATREAGPHDG